ncbi:MAG: hypothetical protein PG981_000796 [Wolbachia endosymbiont of Ctenocephalides orientis wCori]|nr:MAG: hypothetical protein PG981_000796 [Wolbachia endosymbiont of Ctenocephalides orientis wCori]
MGKDPSTAVSEPKKGIMSSILGFFGRLALAPGKMFIYPVWPMKVVRSLEITWPVKFTLPLLAYPKNWPNSFGEIRHDFKNGFRGLIKMPPKEYNPPIPMAEDSKSVGITVESYEKGVSVLLKMPRSRIGDIPRLTNEQLKEIEAKLSSISISREKNEIVIKINVKQIVTNHELLKKIREEFGSNISGEAITILAIAREIERNFAELAKITGGELGKDTDPKLLWHTAKKLLSEHTEQQKESSEVVTPMQSNKPSEKIMEISKDSSEALKNIGKEIAEVMSASPQAKTLYSGPTKQPEKSSEVVVPKHSGTGFADTVLSSKKGDKENKLKGF